MVERVLKEALEAEAEKLVKRVEREGEIIKEAYSANAHLLAALKKFLDRLGIGGKV